MSTWRSAALGLGCGLIFAAGLVLSGMSDPGRVLGFLDFAGEWDPRLAFVMLGAIGVHFTWLRLAMRRHGPAPKPSRSLRTPPSLAPWFLGLLCSALAGAWRGTARGQPW